MAQFDRRLRITVFILTFLQFQIYIVIRFQKPRRIKSDLTWHTGCSMSEVINIKAINSQNGQDPQVISRFIILIIEQKVQSPMPIGSTNQSHSRDHYRRSLHPSSHGSKTRKLYTLELWKGMPPIADLNRVWVWSGCTNAQIALPSKLSDYSQNK